MKFKRLFLVCIVGCVLGVGLLFFCRKFDEKRPKLSIIVPVYNSEKYLSKCLDSLISQTFNNTEIICINDGSKDDSLNILKEYAAKDSRVRVIDQPNKGVSVTRNKGILAARGKYITFVDSDDWLDEYAYELCMDIVLKEKPEVFFFGYRTDASYKAPSYIDESSVRFHGRGDIVDAYNETNPTVWDKIFDRKFILRNDLSFKEDMSYAEDHVFNLMAFAKADKIIGVPNKFYYYREDNQSSLVHVMNSTKRLEDKIKANKYLISYFRDLEIHDFDLEFAKEMGLVFDLINNEIKDKTMKARYAREVFKAC